MKKIKFTSNIVYNNEQTETIEFTSDLKLTNENGFLIYEFNEKKDGQIIENKIQIEDILEPTKIEISSGFNSIKLKLNEITQTDFTTEHGVITFYLVLEEIQKNNNSSFSFKYKIWIDDKQKDLLGSYNISIETF